MPFRIALAFRTFSLAFVFRIFLPMRNCSLVLILLLPPLFLFAKDNGRFRHYTTEDGLSQNSAYAIIQDQQGFMWIGTSDGLCRYDGYHFTIFRPDANDSSTISNNVIRSMISSRDGKIWIGTRDGLNCFDPVTGKFKRFYHKKNDASSIADNTVLALCEDRQGRIWCATLTEGVSIYNPQTEKFTTLRHKANDPATICGDDVRGFCLDKNGHMWMATWKYGVCEYDVQANKTVTFISSDQLSYPNTRGAICCDASGKIYIGTWMHGLNMYDPATKKIVYEVDNTPELPDMLSGMIWKIMQDRNGRIIIATAEQGLVIYDPVSKAYRKYAYDPDDPWALNDKSVWSVCQDRSGQIWAGTWRGGINVLDERMDRFELLRFDSKDTNSLPAATVWGMCNDGGNGLWFGTAAGPVHYDPATKIYRKPEVYPVDIGGPPANSDIQSLACDRNKNIWMGSTGNGAYLYDVTQKKFQHFLPDKNDPHTIGDNIVNCICTDQDGNIWFGAGHYALQEWDPAIGFVTYPFDEKDSLVYGVYTMAKEGKDNLLLGMLTGEVIRFNIHTKKYSILWKNPSAIGISSLYADRFGGIWAGTNGSGLVYLKGNEPVFFTEKDSLPNNVINGIMPGVKDELWLSSNRGLCRFDPVSREVRSYAPADGLQGNEFNQNCYARTPDGKLWFGGVKGVTAFYPKDITRNLSPAPVVITSFTVLNRPFVLPQNILFTNEIDLTYKDYFFSFDFAGLEYTNPSRNHYRYMMEGFDENWIDADTRRFATYTNLDPGEYTFHVMASNNDGYWSDSGKSIRIIISPPFWKTKWFYALCGMVILLSVWGYIRWREKQLRKDKLVLETKVKERTFELNQEKEKVSAAHKDIRDSINYAKRIQYALLAHENLLKKNLAQHLILFKPKDVVSGDFYWATEVVRSPEPGVRSDIFYLAVCDSTGHGVPGAFMSLLNISFLNEAIIEKKMEKPGEVFDYVRKRLIENISAEGGQDGMDAILVCFDKKKNKITYAAAHNAPLIIRNKEIIQLETDKMPVGKGEKNELFATREIDLRPGDTLYLYTDGYADQFGGPQGKKFKETNLRKLLSTIAHLPMEEQQERLEKEFESWKGELEQVDDTLIVGLRV
jgi:ligand-binding sensor domain-containing protein/serine phosphatase RsbU (regulator of sigma subunit)